MSEFKLYQLTNAVVGLEEMNFDEETRELILKLNYIAEITIGGIKYINLNYM